MAQRASDLAYARLRADIVDWRIPPGTVLAETELSVRLGVSRTPIREALGRLVADGLAAPQGGRGVMVTAVSLEDARNLFDVRVALDGRAAALAAHRADRAVFADLADRLRTAADVLGRAAGQDQEPHIPDSVAVPQPATVQGQTNVPPPAAVPQPADAPQPATSQQPVEPAGMPDGNHERADDYYALVGLLDEAIDTAVANPHLLEAQRRLRTQLTRLRRLARDNPRRLARSALEHAAIAEAIAGGDADLAVAATRLHLANALAGITTAIAVPRETAR